MILQHTEQKHQISMISTRDKKLMKPLQHEVYCYNRTRYYATVVASMRSQLSLTNNIVLEQTRSTQWGRQVTEQAILIKIPD